MKPTTHTPINDSDPSFLLPVAGLREVIRQEVTAAVSQVIQTSSHRGNDANTKTPASKDCFRVKEAAEFLRVSPSTIRSYISKGKLKRHKLGRSVILRRADLEELLRRGDSGKVVELYSH